MYLCRLNYVILFNLLISLIGYLWLKISFYVWVRMVPISTDCRDKNVLKSDPSYCTFQWSQLIYAHRAMQGDSRCVGGFVSAFRWLANDFLLCCFYSWSYFIFPKDWLKFFYCNNVKTALLSSLLLLFLKFSTNIYWTS